MHYPKWHSKRTVSYRSVVEGSLYGCITDTYVDMYVHDGRASGGSRMRLV